MIAINLTMRLPDEESVEAMLKKLHRRRKQISIKSPYYVEIKSSTLDASAIKVRKVTKRFTLMAIAVWGNELPDRPHEPEIEYELKARLIAFPWDVIYQGESVEDKMAYMNPEWGYL
jgi:hypothetical protein